jgi:protein-disulfide isomerase
LRFRSYRLTVTRRAVAPILSLFGLVALLACASALPREAMAQNPPAALVSKPVSLPDMAVGTAKAPVTIVEYASMTCPHCAAFEQNVFPMLKSKYIDTGKVRFVFREFPLDIKAAAASMLTRCIAGDDAGKFFATIDLLFKQQDQLMEQTKDTLKLIGKQAGMDEGAVETCEKDQVLLDKLKADQTFAFETLKVDATPTLFVNGERLRGSMSFEELEERIKPLLKK